MSGKDIYRGPGSASSPVEFAKQTSLNEYGLLVPVGVDPRDVLPVDDVIQAVRAIESGDDVFMDPRVATAQIDSSGQTGIPVTMLGKK